MDGFIGRKIGLKWGGEKIAGAREKGVALNGEPINVSDDDSSGWQELLDEAGEDSVTLSISGVTKDDALKFDWFNGDRKKPVEITYPDGGVISGDFFLASYSDTGPYQDATTFEAELQSSGRVEYAPGDIS